MSSFSEAKRCFTERRCGAAVDRLQRNGFKALYVASKEARALSL